MMELPTDLSLATAFTSNGIVYLFSGTSIYSAPSSIPTSIIHDTDSTSRPPSTVALSISNTAKIITIPTSIPTGIIIDTSAPPVVGETSFEGQPNVASTSSTSTMLVMASASASADSGGNGRTSASTLLSTTTLGGTTVTGILLGTGAETSTTTVASTTSRSGGVQVEALSMVALMVGILGLIVIL